MADKTDDKKAEDFIRDNTWKVGTVRGTEIRVPKPFGYNEVRDLAKKAVDKVTGGSRDDKKVPSFRKGGRVERDGIYQLHAGERVLNKRQARRHGRRSSSRSSSR
jgi:hypothetical protein